jgi:phage shock protein PspC (stress-responsive transcriptional regulator)
MSNAILKRDTKNGLISGVCAGIAKYLDVDPLFMRIAFILSVVCSGTGVLIYLLLWLLIPEEE